MNENKKIPQHIAIIMDGNGRWAKQRGKDRSEGHFAGMMALRETVKAAAEMGVKYLTVYAFSTENWGRPEAEVEALMQLVCKGVEMNTPELRERGVRVEVIGARERFSDEVNSALDRIISSTAEGERMTLVLALNYSSRSELTVAVQHLARRVAEGEIRAEEIDEQMISQSLYTASMPDPDLIVRTSGECRLSNFLMWQASYAEFYFTPTLWPDLERSSCARLSRPTAHATVAMDWLSNRIIEI
jgi:undecaprenyl diphosphate synthase